MKSAVFPLILLGVILNTGAQLLLKAGMNRIGHFEFALSKLFSISLQVAMNPYILMGLLGYVVSVVIWLLVLSRVDVSFAYPMISLGYVLNAVTAYYLFEESLSITRILGIVVILCGVYLVARS
jgi:multidrug transporter EmrE-like cation transporter